MHGVVVQLVGFCALVLGTASFQVNNRRRLLVLQLASSILWVFHFYMLGAVEAAAMNTVGFGRTFLFARVPTKNVAQRNAALLLVLVVYGLASVLTWHSARSFFPLAGSVASTLALWQISTRKIRLVSVADPPFWFSYNLLERSYPGILNEVVVFGSILIAIARYDVKPVLRFAYAVIKTGKKE